MVTRQELQNYLHLLLDSDAYADYCPNGLQVEGAQQINKIVCGVTACQALLDVAVQQQADTIMVHHGIFWKGQSSRVLGMQRHRLATLLHHEINLFAYHLPLDCHTEYGNNVQLAKLLHIDIEQSITVDKIPDLLWVGQLPMAMLASELSQKITQALQRQPLHISGGDQAVQKIAWCTGAAQRYIEQAKHYAVDAYLTGEASEQTVHFARENGMHFYAAGHHATERYGIQALAKHLAQQFDISCEFVDIENPV